MFKFWYLAEESRREECPAQRWEVPGSMSVQFRTKNAASSRHKQESFMSAHESQVQIKVLGCVRKGFAVTTPGGKSQKN